jgi:hypothetical protein
VHKSFTLKLYYQFKQEQVRTKMAVFWVVAPYSLVEVYQRFRGPCCLHDQGDTTRRYNPEDSRLVT